MGTKYQSRTQERRTHYEWRWAEEFASESRVIPESWARNGGVEDGDGEPFYAVKVRPGLFFEYEVSDRGGVVSGPHAERQGMLIGYTNSSCDTTVVRRIIKNRNHSRTLKPSADFRAIITPDDHEKLKHVGLSEEVGRVLETYYNQGAN